jgi:hypothetical protein
MNADGCVLFKVGTAKADPTGSRWAPFPVYLPFRWGEPINAAKAIMDLDQIVQVPEADRKTTPVFVKHNGRKWPGLIWLIRLTLW